MYTKYSLSSTTDCLLEVFGRLTYLCSLNLILDVYDKSMMFNRTHEMVFDRYEKNVIASLVSCWQTYILETKVVACPANLHVSLRWKPARRTHRHDLWVLPRRRDDIGGVVVDDCDCRCTNRFADEQCHRGDLAPSFSLARLHRRVRFRATAPPLPELGRWVLCHTKLREQLWCLSANFTLARRTPTCTALRKCISPCLLKKIFKK